MEKIEYIVKQLSRAEKKRFEHFVVTRIWHLLNDLTLKFITQQYVVRPFGRALTDMYFPQLGIHIEVDETHHLNQQEQDQLRQADIVNATNHVVLRIDTSKGIENLHMRIDEVINLIRDTKANLVEYKPWNMAAELDPMTYKKQGFIDLKDDCAFRTMVEAANCFGNNFKPKGIWKGGAKHPKENGKIIWFPKLYRNGIIQFQMTKLKLEK